MGVEKTWGLCSYCQPSVDETTVNDCDPGLKNRLRSNRRPAHLAALVHSAVHEKIGR
jgi:hypothetical protein